MIGSIEGLAEGLPAVIELVSGSLPDRVRIRKQPVLTGRLGDATGGARVPLLLCGALSLVAAVLPGTWGWRSGHLRMARPA